MNNQDAFDIRLRAAHAASLDALSPRVRAQLAQRRRLALATPRSQARPLLGWALATFAVCAVAVGVFRPDTREAQAPVRVTAAAAPSSDAFEDNPDFYLWLASRDADSLASE